MHILFSSHNNPSNCKHSPKHFLPQANLRYRWRLPRPPHLRLNLLRSPESRTCCRYSTTPSQRSQGAGSLLSKTYLRILPPRSNRHPSHLHLRFHKVCHRDATHMMPLHPKHPMDVRLTHNRQHCRRCRIGRLLILQGCQQEEGQVVNLGHVNRIQDQIRLNKAQPITLLIPDLPNLRLVILG
jgi:hypothetical protein